MSAKRNKTKDREKDRDRIFHLILYPENPEHMFVIMQLRHYHYKSVGILHNADKYEEDVIDTETGELKYHKGDYKKEHYHFRIHFDNPRYIKGVADELGIEPNLIRFPEKWHTLKNYSEYLLHWNESGKHQYNINELVGSLAGEVKQKLIDMPVTMQFGAIMDYIDNADILLNYKQVLDYARDSGYLGVCLRNRGSVQDLIAIHNERYCRKGR